MSRADNRRAGFRANRDGTIRPAACCRTTPCERHAAVKGVLLEVRKSGKWQNLGVLGKDGKWILHVEPGHGVVL